MNILKVIIIDDEINGVESLAALLAENCRNVDVKEAVSDPALGIEAIRKHCPDVVFLDIQMPAMSGFELLEKVKDISFHVVFITAYDHYAVKAFRHNAVDYLLKPLIVSELVDAVNKISTMEKDKPKLTNIAQLLEKIKSNTGSNKLAVSSMNEILYIDTDRIIRLESDSNYSNIILLDGKKINSTKTLKEYEHILDPKKFFRAFKTHIVNLDQVQKFIKTDGGYLIMADGTEVPVSREKKHRLLELLESP
ncbi:MAG TPA: LytTR family DNA-binding domain-containing protein [Flavobacteriales bacterium]|nr:LytTR family DNA-binding domain-containing protein [Flavobacteriales bacterium]